MDGMEQQIIRPGYLTAHQTASVLGVGLPAVRQLVRRGQLARSGGTVGQPWYAAADLATTRARKRVVSTFA
jgi:hypothetical protein